MEKHIVPEGIIVVRTNDSVATTTMTYKQLLKGAIFKTTRESVTGRACYSKSYSCPFNDWRYATAEEISFFNDSGKEVVFMDSITEKYSGQVLPKVSQSNISEEIFLI